ncbi:MAG: sugar phosphate isomerase/epimerase [Planctomycetota bacterium]|nr:sugar phosphate isomerase/epimerase [Planctomycetota bacterium]
MNREIGVELYVFGPEARNAEALSLRILPALRHYGYACVESFAQPLELPELLKRAGLRLAGVHLATGQLAKPEKYVAFAKAGGCADLCVSGPLNWKSRGRDDYLATAKFLNESAKRLAGEGLRLHYHNHEFEFARIDGGLTALEVLLAELDPAVDLCLDAGWVWAAGVDAAALLRRHAERIGFLHLRDFRGPDSVALGAGEVPLAEHLRAVAALPRLRELIVEHDPITPDPLGAMRASLEWLRANG